MDTIRSVVPFGLGLKRVLATSWLTGRNVKGTGLVHRTAGEGIEVGLGCVVLGMTKCYRRRNASERVLF